MPTNSKSPNSPNNKNFVGMDWNDNDELSVHDKKLSKIQQSRTDNGVTHL